ncbi:MULTISPECIES: phosphatase PAP2 family protein [unclassified Flavobacterium]|uniref:phosphatase PAP2 family protein n=1 Tax=unclassified Flavobacterium TaxID=196869 RepID=UPI001F140353|nr:MULTISPECIES: phosphatase PAP2 family protein [unclassified Flavobacterium]UMY64988.1 phosphatase PAP2 family protein [Flavobacterium sp. HJ-32-4]
MFILAALFLYLNWRDALNADRYIGIQKVWFYELNTDFSWLPGVQYNLTQFGDAFVFLSFLTLLFVYAPRIWESLISALLLSFVLTCPLKSLVSVPRPAAVFDHGSFVIVGKALRGHNSLPSGHSITVFTVLTVLIFALAPERKSLKIIWYCLTIFVGVIVAFTRVTIGAHYPLDVIIGGVIGYILGILGIFASRRFRIWGWINNVMCYPFLVLLILGCCVVFATKIIQENLFVYYLAMASLLVSLKKISNVYLKKGD